MATPIPTIETKSREDIKIFQSNELKKLLSYLQANSPFYQRHFSAHQIEPKKIDTVDDLHLIEPTTKDDLQRHQWDFLCVSRQGIKEYTSTSGTLGKPVIIGLTEKDIQRLAYNEYISFACAGGSSKDLYQLMLTLDRQFMAGMAYYEGIRKLGGGVIRVGPGLPALQWETIQRLKPTVLVGVPTFIIKLIYYASQQGIDLSTSSVRSAICIGENIRTSDFELNTIGKKIKAAWDIQLFSTYASTEMQTAFTECAHGIGGHHHPELLIVEIVNESNEPLPFGQLGEVTVTTLGVEGMPLLRYKTGDMAIAHEAPCACGRNTIRLGPIEGRKQQMIKLKGTSLYPAGVFEILQQVPDVHDFLVEAYTGELDTDELRIHIHTEVRNLTEVEKSLRSAFQSRIRIVPELNFITVGELESLQMGKQERKVKRFMDNRK
jgi:phenylacetate-CoA ligase